MANKNLFGSGNAPDADFSLKTNAYTFLVAALFWS
jgi:hypothetical protein